MNLRDRFVNTLTFTPGVRPPEMDFGYWSETIDVWHGQGLPETVRTDEEVEDFFGLDRGFEHTLPVEHRLHPFFPEEILEDHGDKVIKRNRKGVVLETMKWGGSIPRFLRFPVENPADFEVLRGRLDGADPGRYPADWPAVARAAKLSGRPLGLTMEGFLAHPRELMGLEGLSLAFYDQPDLILAINEAHASMTEQLFTRALADLPIDYVLIWEDMAYKNAPLVSPDCFARFMAPFYRRAIAYFRRHGVRLILVDCDGRIERLIQPLRDLDVDGLYPCEIQAGSDPALLRRDFPDVPLIGGINKIALARGPEAIEAELAKIPPLVAHGGYVPAVDHRVPPDVPLQKYAYFGRRRR